MWDSGVPAQSRATCLGPVVVRVVITAGYRVKTHSRGDRVCSVLLCNSEYGCGRVSSSFVESWVAPRNVPMD